MVEVNNSAMKMKKIEFLDFILTVFAVLLGMWLAQEFVSWVVK